MFITQLKTSLKTSGLVLPACGMTRLGKAREMPRPNAKNLEGNMFNRDWCTKDSQTKECQQTLSQLLYASESPNDSLLNIVAFDFYSDSFIFN